jgi:hypothetical protein
MDWINSIFSHYNEITKMNPLVATIAIPLVGGLMFYLKNLPSRLWDMFIRYTTVTLSLNNAGYDGNIDAYVLFDKWFMHSGYKRFSRNFFMFRQWREELFAEESYAPYRLGIGFGYHFFFYEGRLFWFMKRKLDSSGAEREKEEITVRTFGLNNTVFERLTVLFNAKRSRSEMISIHTFKGRDGWKEVCEVLPRDISTFCMNLDQKNDIMAKIQHFIDSRDWYRRKGLTYKSSFLFYGPPGTGKTTLSRLLAMHFRRDIYTLDLSTMTNETLVTALANIRPGSFLLLEDVDQAGNAVRKRKADAEKQAVEIATEALMGGGLTMSGLLNALDGVVGLDNLIIIMTTNHPEDLDPAVRRKSRIDHEYLIGELTSKEIWEYVLQMYDTMSEEHHDRVYKYLASSEIRLPGCDVENLFKENPDNPVAFLVDVNSLWISRQPLPA